MLKTNTTIEEAQVFFKLFTEVFESQMVAYGPQGRECAEFIKSLIYMFINVSLFFVEKKRGISSWLAAFLNYKKSADSKLNKSKASLSEEEKVALKKERDQLDARRQDITQLLGDSKKSPTYEREIVAEELVTKKTTVYPDNKCLNQRCECGMGNLNKFESTFDIRHHLNITYFKEIIEFISLRCSGCQEFHAPNKAARNDVKRYGTLSAQTAAYLTTVFIAGGEPYHRISSRLLDQGIIIRKQEIYQGLNLLAKYLKLVYQAIGRQVILTRGIVADDTPHPILLDQKEAKEKKKTEGKKNIIVSSNTSCLVAIEELEVTGIFFQTALQTCGLLLGNLIEKYGTHPDGLLLTTDGSTNCNPVIEGTTKNYQITQTGCLDHVYRKIVDDTEGTHQFLMIQWAEKIKQIYILDKELKQFRAQQRTESHFLFSLPILSQIKAEMEEALDKNQIEPNSKSGKICKYYLNQYDRLIQFTKIENVPLSNCLSEQGIKAPIRHRKNSSFFQTLKGAETYDILLTIMRNCVIEGMSFNYYLKLIDENRKLHPITKQNAEKWTPKNILATLQKIKEQKLRKNQNNPPFPKAKKPSGAEYHQRYPK